MKYKNRKIIIHVKSIAKAIAIALVLFLVNVQHTFAVNFDGRFQFSYESTTIKTQCLSTLNVLISSPSQNSNAANVIISFDPDKVEIIDANPKSPGTQIFTGAAYELYADNIVDYSSGQIRLTGFSVQSHFYGTDNFGTIKFKPKTNVSKVNFNVVFYNQGETLDSNIADLTTSDDVLSGGESVEFHIIEGTCEKDTQPPSIIPVNPQNYAPNVTPDSNIQLKICDYQSGVDLKTVKTIVNGVEYNFQNKESFDYNLTDNCYNININPLYNFKSNSPVLLIVHASDLAGNSTSSSFVFNVPPETKECYDLLSEKDKKLSQVKVQLSSCLEKSHIHSLPQTGIFSEFKNNYNWLVVLSIFILVLHPFWRNPKESDLLRKLFINEFISIIMFIFGLSLAIIAIFIVFNFLNALILAFYILASIYKILTIQKSKMSKTRNS